MWSGQHQRKAGANMSDDTEIAWHREQIAKNRTVLEELEAGNSAGGDVFPETQSEIDRLKAQITQSVCTFLPIHLEPRCRQLHYARVCPRSSKLTATLHAMMA